MFNGRFKRFIVAITIFLLMAATSFAGNPPLAADTARIVSWAKEARQLLQSPGNAERADSVIYLAKQAVSKEKLQTPLLLYWALAESAFQRKDYGNAYDMAAHAMKSPQSQIGLQAQGELMIFFAKTCQYTGQFKACMDYLDKTVEFAGFNHLKTLSAKACNALAEVYTVVGDPEKVRESLERMLLFARIESDSVSTLAALYKLGKQNFGFNYDFDTVDRYMRQSLEYSVPLGDTAAIASALGDIAWNFYLKKELDSSLFYYQVCVDYASRGKRYYSLANALGNMGTIYRDLKKFDKALAYWKKGITTAREYSDWYTQSWIYSDMSKMASDQDLRRTWDENQRREDEQKEKERIRQERQARKQKELDDFKYLLSKSERRFQTEMIRHFIDLVEKKELSNQTIDQEKREWIAWARKKADWFDPFIEADDELLRGADRKMLAFFLGGDNWRIFEPPGRGSQTSERIFSLAPESSRSILK